MKHKKLPRLCRVLGVVPDEIFSIVTTGQEELEHCWVSEDGLLYFARDGEQYTVAPVLCDVINHPECVVYQTPLTPPELQLIRSIRSVYPDSTKLAWGDKCIRILDAKRRILGRISFERLPGIRQGDTIEIDKVIGGTVS